MEKLAGKFFPEAIENIRLNSENKELHLAMKMGEEFAPLSKEIHNIVKSYPGVGEDLLKEKIKTEIFNEKRFTISLPNSFDRIKRYERHFSNPQDLFDRITLLLGAPKVGKKNLVQEAIEITSTNYKWFSVPLVKDSENEFLDAILFFIYSRKLSDKDASERVRSPISLEDSESEKKILKPVFIVVDNVHLSF